MTAVRLLDGGMGQELYRRSAAPDDRLWSAREVLDQPDLVRALHEEFLRAGAEIITTVTYATTRWRMIRAGAGDRWAEANRNAVGAAELARDTVNPGALIAGSLPPLRGSYQPESVPSIATMEAEYAEQALLLAPHVDLFVAETLTTSAEAIAAARAAGSTGRPVWIAFTLTEDEARLRGGESIAGAVAALAGLPVEAILLNCTAPEAVTVALPELARVAGARPVGAYANGFVTIPDDYGTGSTVADLVARQNLDPDAYAAHAAQWLDAGATIVGGCCEVGPAHIARLRVLLDARR